MQPIPASFRAILAGQAGVATRRQTAECGISPQALKTWLRVGSARSVLGARGVYLFECGRSPSTYPQRIWAALLAIGGDVISSHDTAIWLAHPERTPPWLVHVAVPDGRRVRPIPGVKVHTLPRLIASMERDAVPKRVAYEFAVMDTAHSRRDVRAALAVVYAALQSRHTTAARLRDALAARPRHRHRAAIAAILTDAEAGAMSGLERRHLHVMRNHGLPTGRRQRKLPGPTGSRWVDVIVDEELDTPLVTELDGRRGHEEQDGVWRDMDRDNLDEEQGRGHLRYGAAQLFEDGCGVAAQTFRSLRRRGWSGSIESCGPECGAIP